MLRERTLTPPTTYSGTVEPRPSIAVSSVRYVVPVPGRSLGRLVNISSVIVCVCSYTETDTLLHVFSVGTGRGVLWGQWRQASAFAGCDSKVSEQVWELYGNVY